MDKKIKVLYIIDSFRNPFAGTEGQILKLIDGINRDKIEPHFVIFKNSEYLKSHNMPVSVDILGINKIFSPFSWLKLYKYFLYKKNESYCLAHIFFNDASLICPFFLKLHNYKVIISRRDMGYWHSSQILFLLKLNTIFVDKVIANSKAVKKITIKNEGYVDSQVSVIYNGYNENELDESSNNLCNDIRISANEIRLVLVANIRPIKRISDAIHAISKLKINYNDISLYIIGKGDQYDLIKLSNKLGISSSIHFLGSRNDILKILPLFDIGILCSESEGLSNTIIEYFYKSLPVICTNSGGNPELVKNNVNGYLYDVGDIETLSRHIEHLIENKDLRHKLGCNGLKYVKNNFTISKYIKLHESTYEKLINNGMS